MEEGKNGRMEEGKNGRMEEGKNGRMEEGKNGRMEEGKNGRMERRAEMVWAWREERKREGTRFKAASWAVQ